MTKGMRSWFAWGVVTLFYAYQYILKVAPAIMIDDIREKFTIDATQFGTFSGVYYIGYSLIHLPLGYWLDRFGPRLVVTIAILISLLGMIPLVYSDSWTMAVLGRFLLGAGSAGAILGVFKVIRQEFPAHRFATLLGFSVTVGVMGAMYGGAPVEMLMRDHGWMDVSKGLIILGAVLAGVTFMVFSNHKKDHEPTNPPSLRDDISALMRHKKVWWVALCAAMMVGPLEGFADVWGRSFLINVYGLSKETAAFAPSLMFIGMAIGCPLLARVSEKYNAFLSITRYAGLGMGILCILFLYFKLSVAILYPVFFIIGILSAYQVLAIHLNGVSVSKDHAGLVTAFTNMVIMSFGSVFHYGIGSTMDLLWDGQTAAGVPVYAPQAYSISLGLIPLGCFLGFIGFQKLLRKRQKA